jgi:hypothetical protein
MGNMIDFGELTKIINGIENYFAKHGLNPVEQDLVIREINARLQAKAAKQRTDDMLSNMPVVGAFMNKFKKDEEPTP